MRFLTRLFNSNMKCSYTNEKSEELCRSDDNPFRDIRIMHQTDQDAENICVSIDSSEVLDESALKDVLAELIAAELVKLDVIDLISDDSTDGINYMGCLSVLRSSIRRNHSAMDDRSLPEPQDIGK